MILFCIWSFCLIQHCFRDVFHVATHGSNSFIQITISFHYVNMPYHVSSQPARLFVIGITFSYRCLFSPSPRSPVEMSLFSVDTYAVLSSLVITVCWLYIQNLLVCGLSFHFILQKSFNLNVVSSLIAFIGCIIVFSSGITFIPQNMKIHPIFSIKT